MDHYSYIRENYKKTVASLVVAVKECTGDPSDLMIDGLIQRFEFCTDFALKSCTEYLDTAGHRIEGTPKVVLKKASDIQLIDNLDLWFQIVADRETTAQIYDKSAARRIMSNVKRDYISLFQDLSKRFS
ncbi:MAG: HI0074 family nucleotidyltransferase substrate-binding subunit [Eubacteriales bacterium]